LAEHQVAIVGGGPVGLALAVELGQRDISCVLVERHRQPQRIPKGQNLTSRTLEHFYFWKGVEQLRAARVLPPGYPVRGVTAYGNLMSPYTYTTNTGGGPGVQEFYFERNERLPQYCTAGSNNAVWVDRRRRRAERSWRPGHDCQRQRTAGARG
jgi:4-hydroxyisophthalate hydroxylase